MTFTNKTKNESITNLGITKDIIKIKKGKIQYPNGKSYNFSDPEEKIRASIFIELVEKYQYPKGRLDTEVLGPRREPKLPADIVIYEDDNKESPFIVVETKANASTKNIEEAKREGLGNSNLLNAAYLLIVCGTERIAYDVRKSKGKVKHLEKYKIADIPIKYGKIPEYRYKKGNDKWDLKKVGYNNLNSKFQVCHNTIWEGGKRDPATSFDEVSKLLITKIYDERFTSQNHYYKFQIGTNETSSEVARRIKSIYKEVQEKEPTVFYKNIELPEHVIYRLVETLQEVSLIKTDLDAKGRAFEHFLGKLFRGEYGQYFTPRPVVQFMVDALQPKEKDMVIDPACGSGGFLLYSWLHVKNKIQESYKGDTETIRWIDFNFSHKQMYGIEINDRIARVAMMDMAIHEDGHSNIECNDALTDFKNFDPKKEIKKEKFDLILTNPPFGSIVKDKEIIKNYVLGKNKKRQRTEVLFLERCYELLKDKGRMGIVIPNSILSNPSESYVRDFIKNHYKIKAIVGTPFETFKSAGANVRSSLLLLEKKSENSKVKSSILFAKANYVGYDNSGKEIKENDFVKILKYLDAKIDIGKFVSTNPYVFRLDHSKLEDNLTADYYIQRLFETTQKDIFYELSELVEYRQENFRPQDFPDKMFKIVSVHFDGTMSLREEKKGSDFRYTSQFSMRKGDIVLSRIDCSHGAIAVVPEEFDGAVCSGEFYVLTPKKIDALVLWYLLRSKQVSEQMIGLSSGMTGRHRLSRKELLIIKVPRINHKIQNKFLDKMRESTKLQNTANKLKKEALEILDNESP